MKKITILFWEGLSFSENDFKADVIIHQDPSDESGALSVVVKNKEILSDVNSIFYDEMLEAVSETEFETYQDLEDLKVRFSEKFLVSVIESQMTPQFINGGRTTVENGNPL